jgi:hypothetical protein
MLLALTQAGDNGVGPFDVTKNLLTCIVIIKLESAYVFDLLNVNFIYLCVIFIFLACFLHLKLGNNSRT